MNTTANPGDTVIGVLGLMVAAGSDPGPLAVAPEPDVHRLTPEEAADPVDPYVRGREDGTVVVFCTQLEMGQGVHTGFATLVAEELDADFDSVRVVNAANGAGPGGDVYGNPDIGGAFQLTGASNSMKGSFLRYRRAGAQARARLVAAAAEAWRDRPWLAIRGPRRPRADVRSPRAAP